MFYLIQGGGIRIDGSADLTDCNIYDNVAQNLADKRDLIADGVSSLLNEPIA